MAPLHWSSRNRDATPRLTICKTQKLRLLVVGEYMKSRLLVTACALFVGVGASEALAQSGANNSATPSASSIGDVVITAERRTQSVQSSSLAIQVLSAAAIQDAGVSQVRDVTAIAPGVQVGQGGPATQIYIRGVGDFGSTPVSNAAVATYIDGVFVPRSNAIEGNFYDISRIEVLKGPQGTLYGRNSAGGALNILTNSPVLGRTQGSVNVEIGNYNALNTDGMLNVPIGDDLAVRGAFQVVSRDGYSSQGFDDDHKQSARLQTLWRPNDDFSVRLGGAWTHVGGNGPGYDFSTINYPAAVRAQLAQLGVTVPSDPRLSITDPRLTNVYFGLERLMFGQASLGEAGPFAGISAPPYCVPATLANAATLNGASAPLPFQNPGLCNAAYGSNAAPPGGPYVATVDQSRFQQFQHQDNQYWNLNAEVNWNLGFANLTVIPAYRRVDNDYVTFPTVVYDNGGRGGETSESTSLEVRLAQDTSLVDWVVGAYYFRERQVARTGADPGQLQGSYLTNSYSPNRIRTLNYAAFAQGTWHLSDDLRLITGVRYSTENKDIRGVSYSVYPSIRFTPVPGFTCGAGPADCITDAWSGDKDFDSTNWKLGVEYDLTSHNMLFATASTGFKAGGLNSTSIQYPTNTTPIPYDPEDLTAYEVGSRNRFLDGRLQVNLEAFYWKYKNHQEATAFIRPNLSSASAFSNAGSATMYGADLDIVARLTDNDTVRFNTEYNHTEYDTFSYTSNSLSSPLITGCLVGAGPTPSTQTINCAGFPSVNAPEWSGSMSYTHTFDLSNGGTVDATVSGQFASDRYLSSFFSEQVHAPEYFVTNVNATYRSPDGNWSLSAFGRNLSDELVYTGAYATRGFLSTVQAVNVGAPRTYGIRLGVNF